jgi:hypothetical protein
LSTPTFEPPKLYTGDTVEWTKSLSDYPATAWTLSYALTWPSFSITIAASPAPNGTDFAVSISAATTATFPAGTCTWRSRVSNGAKTYTIETGRTDVIADMPANSAGLDTRSLAKRALDAIEAKLAGRADSGVAEYQIEGRAMKYIPITELIVLRDRYRMDVAREVASDNAASRAAKGLAPAGRIAVRWG